MNQITLQVTGLTKVFNRRKIFSDVAFHLNKGDSLAVTGRNGSGKSTLVKILSGVLSPTRGEVVLRLEDQIIPPLDRFQYIGLVSPYLQLYDEFSGWENLDMVRNVRGTDISDQRLQHLLELVNLAGRGQDLVRTYSSGMKQRLKYAFALAHMPPVLFLDEPTSNLDKEGIQTVYQVMEEQKQNGILIVATNDTEDLTHCEQSIDLNLPVNSEKATRR